MPDPYKVLNIDKSASDKEIKSAYRKLAKKYHPDTNKGDKRAQDKFAQITNAYELLSDKEKRAKFDRGEIDEQGNPKFSGFDFSQARGAQGGYGSFGAQGGAFSAEDILKEFMGGFAGGRGASPNMGGFSFRSGGGGNFSSTAGGGGKTTQGSKNYEAFANISLEQANSGTNVQVILPSGKKIDVKLPKKVKDGQKIRLKGKGPISAFGEVGDAIITVKFKKHKKFQLDGYNLKVDVPITLYEAVLGGKIRVPTLSGKVELNLPPNINTKKSLRLKGKGLYGEGDLLVSLRIILPKKSDSDLENLMRFWREQKPYKVRE